MKYSTTTLFVVLDGHKDSIAVAYAPASRASEVVSLGAIASATATSRYAGSVFSDRSGDRHDDEQLSLTLSRHLDGASHINDQTHRRQWSAAELPARCRGADARAAGATRSSFAGAGR